MTRQATSRIEVQAIPTEQERLEEQFSFRSQIVLLFRELSDKSAYAICKRLPALAEESDARIKVLVSSPRGHVESGDAIHDVIRFINAPVTTVGTGWAGSAATHVFLAPLKERRLCLLNTRFLIYQPAGGTGCPASDIATQAERILSVRKRIARVMRRRRASPWTKSSATSNGISG